MVARTLAAQAEASTPAIPLLTKAASEAAMLLRLGQQKSGLHPPGKRLTPANETQIGKLIIRTTALALGRP